MRLMPIFSINFDLGEMFQGPSGQSFACHVLIVAAGEDVSTKIITFTSQGRWAVCVLSANGAISNATLQHAGVSGGAVTYEGRFEILSLSGSFLPTESNGTWSRTGGLSVSLAGPDGRVIGGGVAGLLMAGSPVQVVVGTFFRETSRNIGSDEEGNSLFKSPNMSGAKLQLPSIQQGDIGIEDALDHYMCSGIVTASEEQSRAYHVSLPPVHSLHCGGSQFPADGCDNNDNISTSRSEQ
ncbi:hypothetical protein KP509_34G016000 [Ceratopteris richardii]|uniref:AT-hook motif nuclear-localized protein n=1 Tax=Ceratopteris richardii TaxID=49495 RepID=A0A8T2QIZ0_CERRI|nr:hypothetical protein KP509_34G016000 [Ceratopteris richardii]